MVLIMRMFVLIMTVLSTAFVADAISKNSPHTQASSPSKSRTAVTTVKKSKGKPKSKTITKPKTAKSTTNIRRSSSSTTSTLLNIGISSQASTSLRRIKKEYKDAVDMGIAYDWANQRLIVQKNTNNTGMKESSSASNATSTAPSVVIEKNQKIICLGPLNSNLRHWHFSFRGAGDIYNHGIYHGFIKLPHDYPFGAPDIQMWTPSGRFIPGTDICLSASSYHPESWTPRWSIFGLVNAFRLHMLSSPKEIGGMTSTTAETLEFARLSLTWKKKWVGGSGSKKKTIIVDHQLLLQQGVLRLENSDNGEVENNVLKQEDNIPLRTEDYLNRAVMEEGDDIYSLDHIDRLDNIKNNRIISSRLFSTVSSIFQMVCFFLVARIILSLFFTRE